MAHHFPILRRVLALAFCLVCVPLWAQDAGTLAARLHSAAADTAIDTEGLQPWHLKADVQLFDEKGKPTEQGTIEEWWASRDIHKVTFTLPSSSVTELRNKDGLFETSKPEVQPPILEDLLDQMVRPMPHENEIDQAKPELRKQKFGKVELDCIMLDQPLKNVAFPPLGLFPTFCLDPGKDSLRMTTELGSVIFIRNRVGRFQGRSVAMDLTANSESITVATAHLSALSTMAVNATDFTPGPNMEPATASTARLGGGVMAGHILTKIPPVYPSVAKQNHIQGAVILHAIIGRDGRIRSLHLISSPDSSLAIAAIAAVRRWIYTPYVLNGLPTEVDTTVTVNFSFAPS